MSDSNPFAGVPTEDVNRTSFTDAAVNPAGAGGGVYTYASGGDHGVNPLDRQRPIGSPDRPSHGGNPISASETIRPSEVSMPSGRGGGEITPSYGESPYVEAGTVDNPVPTSTRLRRV